MTTQHVAKTGLVQDPVFQRHWTGPGHPERPSRLAAIEKKLHEKGLTARCLPLAPVQATREQILRVHSAEYLDRLQRACRDNLPYIDVPDSAICPESYEVALFAAGSIIVAVDAVMTGRIINAFCAIRPPGHHAERNLSMGFCLLGNVAIAAAHLLEAHGLERVAILDWDVHHGNGTQHMFEEDPRVLYISIHGHPGILYPGTGYAHEIGKGRGTGFTLNIPILPPGRDDAYRHAFDEKVLPKLSDFVPQFVLISAGFDAHRLDPLAPLELETESYGWMTDAVTTVAKRHCAGKLVSALEGGYHLEALSDSVALHLERLISASENG